MIIFVSFIFKLESFLWFPVPMLVIIAQYSRSSISGGSETAKINVLLHFPLMIVFNIHNLISQNNLNKSKYNKFVIFCQV